MRKKSLCSFNPDSTEDNPSVMRFDFKMIVCSIVFSSFGLSIVRDMIHGFGLYVKCASCAALLKPMQLDRRLFYAKYKYHRMKPAKSTINRQKTLIFFSACCIIMLCFYIYPKVRATKMDLNVERWYSMKEICEYLGVSRDTVLAWIEKREMPATKIGRLWKFKISEVDAWMKSGVAAEK